MGKQHFVDCLWRVPQWSLVLKTQKCWADLPMSRGQECGFRERCWITETNSSCTASVFGWITQKSFKKFLIYETERPQRSLSSNVNKATLFMQTFTHFFLQHSTGSVLATKKKKKEGQKNAGYFISNWRPQSRSLNIFTCLQTSCTEIGFICIATAILA